MASLGLIWLQMQPDMQLGSTPLTKVNRHSIAYVLCLNFAVLVLPVCLTTSD